MLFPHIFGTDPVPVPTTITVLSETGEFVTEVATDAEGNFAVKLKPGVYWLMPEVFEWRNPGEIVIHVCRLYAGPIEVTVERKALSSVVVGYSYYCLD